MTPALNEKQLERARKNLASIFKGLSSVGQVTVAKALSISEGTVSKMKSDDLPTVADLLAICGLKVVPETYQCYEPKVIDAILALAQDRLGRVTNSAELEWDPE